MAGGGGEDTGELGGPGFVVGRDCGAQLGGRVRDGLGRRPADECGDGGELGVDEELAEDVGALGTSVELLEAPLQ